MEVEPTRLASASWSSPSNEGGGIQLQCGVLRGELPGDDPSAGLIAITYRGTALDASLLSVIGGQTPLAPPAESYVRDDDRVLTHPATDAFPFRTQLYWSARELTSGGVVVMLTVSLQTDLLDTNPLLVSTTTVEQATVRPLDGLACRLDTADGPCVIMAPHPSDAAECEQVTTGYEAVVRFMPPFLEKGVIRRCRLAAIVLPNGVDDETVTAAIAESAAMPLPLTT